MRGARSEIFACRGEIVIYARGLKQGMRWVESIMALKSILRVSLMSLALAARGDVVRGEEAANPFARVGHIVVIYTENRSFDHVFGLFPGADGVAAVNAKQIDHDGAPLAQLPAPRRDDRFPDRLPNAPFLLDKYLAADARSGVPTHDFYVQQEQIDGGKMDRFVEATNVGALVMGHYDGRKLQQWKLAKEFVLADHFFHAAFGGSFLNHIFLICACAPTFPDAPEKMIAKIDPATGWLARADKSPASVMQGPPRWSRMGSVTPDHHAVATLQPKIPISEHDKTDDAARLPLQTFPTIGDRLTEKNVDWAWYAGGWSAVISGALKPYDQESDVFHTHHHPFVYFKNFAPRSAGWSRLKDEEDFFAAIDSGSLPPVSFYKPLGVNDGHPGYSDLAAGDAHVARVVARLRASPNWKDMLIIVAADENGGFWDHVAPPKIDAFGPGARVPALIISPFAKKSFVDHTVYDTTSIVKTIETRFGLAPLTARDAAAADLRNALAAGRR
jgi:acid phosphatase